MSVIAAQMPLMAFIGDMPTNSQNNLANENSGDFLQQITNEETAGKPLIDAAQFLPHDQIQISYEPEAQQHVVPISQLLDNLRLVNEMQNRTTSQPNAVRQVNESTPEQSVVYLLHWLASGHLSHLASDFSSVAAVKVKHAGSSVVANTGGFSNGLLQDTVTGVISLEGKDLALKQGDNSQTDVDAAEQESRRRAADPAIFNEQISPYLKRRLIVSSQEDHTHIILRDYFLDSEDHFSEVRNLLTNIKQNVSGTIKVTINGHHYGDINNYR